MYVKAGQLEMEQIILAHKYVRCVGSKGGSLKMGLQVFLTYVYVIECILSVLQKYMKKMSPLPTNFAYQFPGGNPVLFHCRRML